MNFWYRFERYSGTDWCATLVPVGVLWWYRYVRYGGTDSSATMVPFRRYYHQLMANELKMNHMVVSSLYMVMQLLISLGFIYLIPNTVAAHWIYLVAASSALGLAYVLFKMKYYHLHEEYLKSLRSSEK